MERLEDYIAFDLEFNLSTKDKHLIQVYRQCVLEIWEIDMPMIPVHLRVPL